MYNDDINDALMELQLKETRNGTFRVTKGPVLAKGFERMSAAMSRQFPIFACTPNEIRENYITEKKKLGLGFSGEMMFPVHRLIREGVR